MARTTARYYLCALVFLQTFAMLLCVSTFINHGLKTNQNFEASVRSRIKRQLIPQIIHSKRVRRNSRNTEGNTEVNTLCTYSNSNVLCSFTNRNGYVERSREESPSSEMTETSQEATSREGVGSRESGDGIDKRSTRVTEDIIEATHRWTNHERHKVANSALPHTTTARTTRPISTLTTSGVDSGVRISESLGDVTTLPRHLRKCSRSYCFNRGNCFHDTILSFTYCRCQSGRAGNRCQQTSRSHQPLYDSPYDEYSDASYNSTRSSTDAGELD
ncbi:uncharacterized protein [Watersipora subatra]|uniref:uncharacterized protein isoform X2 n=1 Tax=Watersipora subatra TaxID=2589382 RepID=UPI00355C0A21